MSLPPGQQAVEGFPRFGTHFHRPAPAVPADHRLSIGGDIVEPTAVALADLTTLPRREITADFHCVAGWSATGLQWEGVPFESFYRHAIEPLLQPDAAISHVVFEGLDGYRAITLLDDVRSADVLLADHLHGQPLDSDHGAPLRLVSPQQYGFVSVKHLCRIEVHTAEPPQAYHPARALQLGLQLVKPHPRARVWREERHRHLPAWAVRPAYRLLIKPFAFLAAQGDRRG